MDSLLLVATVFQCLRLSSTELYPVVINTWAFQNANAKSWEALLEGKSAIDAVQAGCSSCEREQCDFTVGFGGSPDENGETVLDAMIMDGNTLNVGAVAGLRRIKSASAVARIVLDHTQHSLLVGDLATAFAKNVGFQEELLSTNYSTRLFHNWVENSCQPNFWTNVLPDPKKNCGPYKPEMSLTTSPVASNRNIGPDNHDTIGIIAIDSSGDVAAGTSSNGAKYKIPGRVGDSPIPGAGCYADSDVGAAAATGDGDVMMRFLPSFVAVEEMRRGAHPRDAAETAISRIAARNPDFIGGIVVLRKDGKFAAACHGMDTFPYSVCNHYLSTTVVFNVSCNATQERTVQHAQH